ncbi:CPBP family glutamic-type intramembrane protease [Crocosphaera sp.]|uniref:CPBP family glutamic-type intramembrane protease n=1 Tax=Crocosphaera sp. TaxID=2729996 RepID=UPI003F268B05|nr:CPBP family glutamic-type intramembrane protease [Crocosphaera sp.]
MELTRLIDAFLSPISFQDCYLSLGVLLSYGLIVLPIGFKTGFLQWKLTKFSAWKFWQVLQLFIMPALIEELIFRVLLLPHPLKTINNIQWLLWAILSLILFIVYHPLNAKFFYPPGKGLFSQPIFLFFAALLGIACTISYKITGSIWTSVIIHWLIVVVWLFLLGGKEKLNQKSV